MTINFKVIASSFATICLVISFVGFISGHFGIGWGFALLGTGAFVISIVASKMD